MPDPKIHSDIPKCNYLDIGAEELALQSEMLEESDITISANPDDAYTC